MLKLCITLITLFKLVCSNGDLTILQHPDSIVFKGHEPLKESLLPDLFTASLGFTIEQDSNWNGMYLKDPFNLPEAIVIAFIEGVPSVDNIQGHHYSLFTDEDEGEIYHVLYKRIEERYPLGRSTVLNIDLADGFSDVQKFKLFNSLKNTKQISYNELNADLEEDRLFIQEINLIHNIADKIASGSLKPDSVPDLYWFKISSLHSLSDLHGQNSSTTKKAKALLNDALEKLNGAFKKAYANKVFFSVISSDTAHTRKIRAADGEPTTQDPNINLAKAYDPNYPVIFNIILWFGIMMAFTLLAISIFIGSMDPGRDSIIYRMTSTRMKKDN